jgi:hypothetical protein
MICDKCQLLDHKSHKTQAVDLAEDKEYMINMIQIFYNKIKTTTEEKLAGFGNKISENEGMIENFFDGEMERIETISKQLIALLDNLSVKVKKLISLYHIKFREQFKSIQEEYNDYLEDLKDG